MTAAARVTISCSHPAQLTLTSAAARRGGVTAAGARLRVNDELLHLAGRSGRRGQQWTHPRISRTRGEMWSFERRFHNHGEGPYYSRLFVESAYSLLALLNLCHY